MGTMDFAFLILLIAYLYQRQHGSRRPFSGWWVPAPMALQAVAAGLYSAVMAYLTSGQ